MFSSTDTIVAVGYPYRFGTAPSVLLRDRSPRSSSMPSAAAHPATRSLTPAA